MRKPPRPRITKPHLKWRFKRDRWIPCHRVTWTKDGKRKEREIQLEWQGDAAELDRLYWQCEAGKHERQKPALSKFTWGALIEAWQTDPRGRGKVAPSTAKRYSSTLDSILEKNAEKDVRKTTRQGLRAIHVALAANTRKADYYIATVSMLWNFARHKLDWPLGDNPAERFELYGKQREYPPWPEWLVDKLDKAPDDVRLAAELIIGTGQRPDAAINMKWDQFSDEWMIVRDDKGDKDFEVFCPERLSIVLRGVERKGAYLLAKNLNQGRGYDAIEKAFRRWRKSLGEIAKPFTLHGLRKLAVVQLAEAGCSDAEIQAVTGQSAETVAYYRKQASRKALSKAAQERRS